MEFLAGDLQQYVDDHTEPEPDLLQRINRDTNLHVLRPRMLSGHLQGRLLSLFSHMIKPRMVLEIGTYTGYGALCLAEGVQVGGKVVTIECNAELTERLQANFSASPFADSIELKVGDAGAIIPKLGYEWDLVFIDADKENYSVYYDLVIDRLAPGGFIIADNVLWSGKVLDPDEEDKDTQALREFNQKVHTDDRVQNVLLPVRDGLMILRKR